MGECVPATDPAEPSDLTESVAMDRFTSADEQLLAVVDERSTSET